MERIMLVDDEPNILRALGRVLKAPSRELEVFEDATDALRRLRTTPVDLILSDYRMPGMDGVAFLVEAKNLQPEAVRLLISGYADREALVAAINEAGIYRFMVKPWEDMDLRALVDEALLYHARELEKRHLADEAREQKDGYRP